MKFVINRYVLEGHIHWLDDTLPQSGCVNPHTAVPGLKTQTAGYQVSVPDNSQNYCFMCYLSSLQFILLWSSLKP